MQSELTGVIDHTTSSAEPPNISGRTIAQIIPAMGAGGAEQAVVDVGRGIISASGKAVVITSGGYRLPELEDIGAKLIILPVATKNPYMMWQNAKRIAHLVHDLNIDILHARSRAPAWSGLWATRSTNVKFMTTYHGIYGEKSWFKNKYNSVMVRGDHVIANSHYTADLINQRYQAIPKNLTTIHRGIDLSAFAQESVTEERINSLLCEWTINENQKIMLLPGRLTSWKGHKTALKAFAELPENIQQNYTLVFVGDAQGRDEYVQDLWKSATQLGIKEQVRMPGHVSDMPAAFSTASLVLNCSTKPEAFGRVAVEAQALGKPMIVSDLGPVKETVLAPPDFTQNEITGWHFTSGDATDLAQKIRAADTLSTTELDALASRARDHVQKNFTTQQMVSKTLHVYESLLQSGI